MGSHRYAVIGAGRQGTAAALDLAVRGDAAGILLADIDPEVVSWAAECMKVLAGWEAVCDPEEPRICLRSVNGCTVRQQFERKVP